MQIIKEIKKMQALSNELHHAGSTIGFVPTMGSLHEGHLSLIDISKQNSDVTVMSIFLNPIQFNDKKDLEKYPVNLERDIELAEKRKTDILFTPSSSEIYPESFETFVETTKISGNLCGESRPGHFMGVTTVVLKLFNIVAPDIAVFGQKDFQQLKVIEKMTGDLNLQIQIIAAPIVREKDGLAMSSRNAKLSPEERARAKAISESLSIASEMVSSGKENADIIISSVRRHIESTNMAKIDYIKICCPDTLKDIEKIEKPSILAIAVFFGSIRLIDNAILLPK